MSRNNFNKRNRRDAYEAFPADRFVYADDMPVNKRATREPINTYAGQKTKNIPEVVEQIATIHAAKSGNELQANIVVWNGNYDRPSLDIRTWNANGEPKSGVSLSKSDCEALIPILQDYVRR